MNKNPNWIMTWLENFETGEQFDQATQLHEVTVSLTHFPGLDKTFWSMIEVDFERGFVLFYDESGDAKHKFELTCTATEVVL